MKYQSDDSNMMNGMRVKLTFTFSAIGTCALIFISISGLTPKELPKEACIILQVEGLCIDGGEVSIDNKEKGYVMFMRNDADADKYRYKYYRDEVLIPFIQSTRKEYDGFSNESNLPIPEDLTAVSWCDGDIAQVASIVDDLDKFSKNKIIANKHSASRTGVEQAADTSKVFPMLKKLEDTYTVSDLSADQCPMKRIVQQAFVKLHEEQRFL